MRSRQGLIGPRWTRTDGSRICRRRLGRAQSTSSPANAEARLVAFPLAAFALAFAFALAHPSPPEPLIRAPEIEPTPSIIPEPMPEMWELLCKANWAKVNFEDEIYSIPAPCSGASGYGRVPESLQYSEISAALVSGQVVFPRCSSGTGGQRDAGYSRWLPWRLIPAGTLRRNDSTSRLHLLENANSPRRTDAPGPEAQALRT